MGEDGRRVQPRKTRRGVWVEHSQLALLRMRPTRQRAKPSNWTDRFSRRKYLGGRNVKAFDRFQIHTINFCSSYTAHNLFATSLTYDHLIQLFNHRGWKWLHKKLKYIRHFIFHNVKVKKIAKSTIGYYEDVDDGKYGNFGIVTWRSSVWVTLRE